MKLLIFTIFILSLVKLSQGKNCTCVPFYQCSDEEFVISDGRGLIEVRNSEICDGVLEVCCNTIDPTATTTTTTHPPKTPKGCGFQAPDSFPWSASLLYKQYPNFVPSYKCRVSLIHPQVAITAAHCLQDKGYYQVRVASTIRSVNRIHLHPSFKISSLQNDLALLILNKPFKMDKIGTVCIPPPEAVLDAANCTTATKLGDEHLKVISLPVVPKERCQEQLRKSRLGGFFQLHVSFLCAGGRLNEDTCGGDGGSPLICPVPGVMGRFQQIGIVSWGIGCGENLPGVYVNLAQFRDFIDEVMGQNGFGIDTYRI